MREKKHSEILFENHLQAVGKIDYVKGKRPDVECIFCAIRDNDPRVTSLTVYKDNIIMICLNLYPYNPGHLMVIPNRHVLKFEDLTPQERAYMFEAVIYIQKVLEKKIHPSGFNVGYNEGKYSGASIGHIHIHIVPRYPSEMGFMDICSKTKIIIHKSDDIMDLIKPEIQNIFNSQKKL